MSDACGAQQPGGRHSCTRDANHWGLAHHHKAFSYERNKPAPPPIEWGEPAVRPAKITPEQATARWGKFPRTCAKNTSKRHRMIWTFPANMTGPRHFPAEYLGITQGTLCGDCYAYDPRPVCVADVTRDWASGRCERKGAHLDDVPKRKDGYDFNSTIWEKDAGAKAWYCASHSPTLRAERNAAQSAIYKEASAKRDRQWKREEEARKVVAEALRWAADELATGEGICEDACEHHECRLLRAVAKYEALA